MKREFLQLEDLNIGDGPIASLGRKIEADIEVRYAVGDGTSIYRGPAISYFGMRGYAFIHDSVREDGMLNTQQRGIFLGLNGMAVGGKRKKSLYTLSWSANGPAKRRPTPMLPVFWLIELDWEEETPLFVKKS